MVVFFSFIIYSFIFSFLFFLFYLGFILFPLLQMLQKLQKTMVLTSSDELVHEKEKYKSITDDLDQTFSELSAY